MILFKPLLKNGELFFENIFKKIFGCEIYLFIHLRALVPKAASCSPNPFRTRQTDWLLIPNTKIILTCIHCSPPKTGGKTFNNLSL